MEELGAEVNIRQILMNADFQKAATNFVLQKQDSEKSLVEHSQGTYLFLTRTSKDVSILQHDVSKGKKEMP